MASCHNSLGGYGILPYPLRPLNILKGCSGLRCTNRDSIAIFPQVSWEFGCVSPPTDFTDLHRWLGCVGPPTEFTEFTEVLLRLFSHGIHGFAQMAWLRKSSHRIHGIHRSFVASVLPRICTDGLVASVLPRNSRNSQKFGCVSPPTDFTDLHRWLGCVCSPTEFTEFTEVLLRLFSHGIHGIHRSLGVLLAAWVWQDAIPSYICVNPCYLWETLLCKKVLCVPWVLWEYSLPRISQINTDGWLR